MFNKLFKGNPYAAQERIKASTDYPGSLLAKLLGDEVAAAPADDAPAADDAQYNDDEFEQAQSTMGEGPVVDAEPASDDDAPY